MSNPPKPKKGSAGRPEERLVIEGNWKNAVKTFVNRRPDDAPKPAKKKAAKKKRP